MKNSKLLKRVYPAYQKRKKFTYFIDEKKYFFERISLRIAINDSQAWLENQEIFPKIYWKLKGRDKILLALDSLIQFPQLPSLRSQKPSKRGPRLFGGVAFLDSLLSKTKYSVWNKFSITSFFIPKYEIEIQPTGKGILSINFFKGTQLSELKELVNRLSLEEPEFQPLQLSLVQRIDMPNFSNWCDTIEKSMSSFETSHLEKVVLARASYLTYDKPLSGLALLKELSKTALNSTLFAFIPSKEGAFIGVSPENFYLREGNKLSTEAIAGTTGKGRNEIENINNIKKLIESNKEDKEFAYVSDFISQKLRSLSKKVLMKSKKTIIETSSIYHLYKNFHAIINEGVTDKMLIETLHPTPAMGGYPQSLAMEFLDQSEPFVRGLYAAPLGWMSPDRSELVVGIRSAFVKNRCLTVFAGAGIIKDSHSSKEWEELELKISHFLKLGFSCS